MSKGWEVAVRVQENYLGFGSTVGQAARAGRFLFVDSETLSQNAEVRERDAKIVPMRLSPAETFSYEQDSPGGEIRFQPRTDDCIHLMYAFFQWGTFMGGGSATCAGGTGGTWVFTPVAKSLAWSGSAFATTSIYPVNIDKYYGEGLSGTGDGERYERGIVSKITLTQEPASDLVMGAELRFLQKTSDTILGTGFKSAPNAIGSFSSKKQLVDWNGTLTVGGVTYAIERINFEFDNQITERRKLGQRGFYQFPFGRPILGGEFELELDNLSAFRIGSSAGTLVSRWQTSDGDWMEVFSPNTYIKSWDAQVSDTGPVLITVPFRCYPTGFGSSNAVVVSVYPKYGTVGPDSGSKLWFG